MVNVNILLGVGVVALLILVLLFATVVSVRRAHAERRRLQANLDSVYNQRERRLRGN